MLKTNKQKTQRNGVSGLETCRVEGFGPGPALGFRVGGVSPGEDPG